MGTAGVSSIVRAFLSDDMEFVRAREKGLPVPLERGTFRCNFLSLELCSK
jgi:hypothetical protein